MSTQDEESIEQVQKFSKELQDLIAKYAPLVNPEMMIKFQMANVVATICGYGLGDKLAMWSIIFSQTCYDGIDILGKKEGDQ